MKTLNEYLLDDIETVHEFNSEDRFWVRAGKTGLNITNKKHKDIYYMLENDKEWSQASSIKIKPNSYAYICINGEAASSITYSGTFDIGGNILGLTRKEYNESDDIKSREFWGAFADSDVVDCRELTITSDRIGEAGMAHMFDSCQSIIYSPDLPSTKLSKGCYMCMFEESNVKYACKNLPATTLADWCYDDMYYSCAELVDTPESLPAMKLARRCYAGMFGDCDNLKEIKFKDLPATKMEEECYFWMFNSSRLTKSPKIHAEILADGCFSDMFGYCYDLKDITFTSSKMTWNASTQVNSFSGWNDEQQLSDKVTLTISKNVKVEVPSSWKIKEI